MGTAGWRWQWKAEEGGCGLAQAHLGARNLPAQIQRAYRVARGGLKLKEFPEVTQRARARAKGSALASRL